MPFFFSAFEDDRLAKSDLRLGVSVRCLFFLFFFNFK
jgi:hypothetical protein